MTFEEKLARLMQVVNKGDLDEYGWHVVQMTQEEAVHMHDTDMDKAMTEKEVVNIQLFQMRKCTKRFFESTMKECKFPTSWIILLQHDMCVNIHLNLPNEEKYNFTKDACLAWLKIKCP